MRWRPNHGGVCCEDLTTNTLAKGNYDREYCLRVVQLLIKILKTEAIRQNSRYGASTPLYKEIDQITKEVDPIDRETGRL